MTTYSTDDKDWTYTQDFRWGGTSPDCYGVEQSPINIDTNGDNVKTCSVLCDLKTYFHPGQCAVNFNKHNELIIDYKLPQGGKKSSITFNSMNHELVAVRIFTPSLHRVDGQQFDMEVMMQFDSGVAPTDGHLPAGSRGVLLCKLLNKSENEFGKEEDFFNQFVHKIPGFSSDAFIDVPVSPSWSIEQLVPNRDSFFYYDGSLPRPPCLEKYTVIVYEEIGNIGMTNYKLIKKYLRNNVRTIQPIGTRTVFYNSGTTQKKKFLDQRDTVLDDKFLQCIKTNEPDLTPIVSEEEEEKKEDSIPFNKKLAKRIKNYFLFFFVIVLFIFAYFTILYMHKTFAYQNILLILHPTGTPDTKNLIDGWKKLHRALPSRR